ncbi:MAG: transposase, partial [Candidatus Bathyarchaeia archaeon]
MRYVEVDVGKQRCNAAVMDEKGFLIEEFSFRNDRQGIDGLASKLSMDNRVVMESTGSVWMNLYESLEEMHISVVLANPWKTKAIASAKIKSDKIDARILAHLLRGDLVAESYV